MLEADWKTVNEYYFKSILTLQLFQYTSLNFHKDFTLEQVNLVKGNGSFSFLVRWFSFNYAPLKEKVSVVSEIM